MHDIATRRRLSEIVEEYDAKRAAIPEAIADYMVQRTYNRFGDRDYLSRLDDDGTPYWSARCRGMHLGLVEAQAAVDEIATYRDCLCAEFGIQGVAIVRAA